MEIKFKNGSLINTLESENIIRGSQSKNIEWVKSDKPMSEYFIKYILNGEKFDFNDFRTKEEFNNYEKELNEFLQSYFIIDNEGI
ncbi:hypothetical protein CIL05_07290 [Virgibacillus profundi]|uniref:Uncharacterized protein n=1 Tax=Virgibacillus profundi TaxID=2024555 RepID=A0A2A2IGK6_9BACI|nr:hypothetical protein [Virgibacillus profundi]PAV30265.1 hypothetical protein CIL05_07290 [Virgibacillus profundi]PXY54437.1 hypothetical protein CIT14_07375 [Virgibacillus profundi]